MPRHLTKSGFQHFIQCPCRFWVETFHRDKLPELDPSVQRIIDQGEIVDQFAAQLYPDAVSIQGYNKQGHANTQNAIKNGATTLLQPTAFVDGLSARADILTRPRKNAQWELHEVKATTKVKSEHETDLAFQKLAFARAGIPVGKTFLVHINNTYKRKGAVDPKKFFVAEDITKQVEEMVPYVEKLIPKAREVFDWGDVLPPDEIEQCAGSKKCEELRRWFASLGKRELAEVLRDVSAGAVTQLLESEMIDPEQLPKAVLRTYTYRTPAERWRKRVDVDGIAEELSKLEYPLYFFDYETYGPAIPPFDGYRPYQQIPFQYSLYVLGKRGSVKKVDFLAEEFADPVPALLASLREAVGPRGSFISWYAPFEMRVNMEIAAMYPEYADFLHKVNDRMYDLMHVFKKKHYVDPLFRGSVSLKSVMPALVPELSYKALAIQEGATASASWPVLTDPAEPAAKRRKLHDDMITYCQLDVYGMVRIYEELRKIIKSS